MQRVGNPGVSCRRRRRLAVAVVAVVLGGIGLSSAWAASRQDSGEPANGRNKLAPHLFAYRFWKYLNRDNTGYENWTSFPGKNGMIPAGDSPHGAFVKLYANRTAALQDKRLPHGAIIVAENYDQDKESLQSIMVMYRVKNYDPPNNDWYWIQYEPDGTVARDDSRPPRPIAGRVESCIRCHSQAGGGDGIFSND